MKEIVIFDVDNTIVEGQSQQLFLNFLFKKKYISFVYYIRIMTWFLFYKLGFVSNPLPVIEYAFFFAKGKKIVDLDLIVNDFFKNILQPKIFPESLEIIKKHQEQGREVILVSNAIDILIKRIAEYLNIQTYLSTKLEIIDGVCTGRIIGGIMYSEQKLDAVKRYAEAKGITLSNSWSYADHSSDIFLLSHTTHPYAVNPTKKLKEFAIINKWPVLNFKL